MKIWCISDTHCKHSWLDVPEVDMIIHAGDASNTKDISFNDAEMREFLQWYESLNIKYKIFVPGNHDTSIERKFHKFEDYPNIKFLIHNSISIEGINIFGSPYTPSFGSGWAYNVARHKIFNYWDNLSDNIDILVTHGPPKGILDLTIRNGVKQCGDKVLLNKIEVIKPKYHIFGHIHNEHNVYNSGICRPNGYNTTFINASVNNLDYKIVNNGIIIEYDN